MKQQTETWKAIPGYEGYYEASDLGRIRSVERKVIDIKDKKERTRTFRTKVLNPNISKRSGRHSVMLSVGGKCKRILVARLVCLAFHGPPPEGKANALHYDDICTNNIPSNLRWGTLKENMGDVLRNTGKHIRYIDGRSSRKRKKRGDPILNEAQVRLIRKLPDMRTLRGLRQSLAAAWGVEATTISSAITKAWQNLSTESLWDMAKRLDDSQPGRPPT